jgi:nucleotide-binding universal stress UspA family protein
VFKKIVVALDGSAHAERALSVARDLAKESGGSVEAVHVREIAVVRGGAQTAHADEPEVERRVTAQVEDLKAAGIAANLHVLSSTGAPAHQIADVADEVGADLIVVGTRGHAAVAGLLLGSVTQRLLHLAHCPVLAIPPAKGA